ncbi:hypothetical protein CISIN_1g0381532mg, partial [Citrus sinensis]
DLQRSKKTLQPAPLTALQLSFSSNKSPFTRLSIAILEKDGKPTSGKEVKFGEDMTVKLSRDVRFRKPVEDRSSSFGKSEIIIKRSGQYRSLLFIRKGHCI